MIYHIDIVLWIISSYLTQNKQSYSFPFVFFQVSFVTWLYRWKPNLIGKTLILRLPRAKNPFQHISWQNPGAHAATQENKWVVS